MSKDAVITSDDLRVVNRFRDALADLQQYQPHRLAGKWWNQFHKPFRIEACHFKAFQGISYGSVLAEDCLESEEGELLYLWDLSDPSQGHLNFSIHFNLFIFFSYPFHILWTFVARPRLFGHLLDDFIDRSFIVPAVDHFRRAGDAWETFSGLRLSESPEQLEWGEHRLKRSDFVILEQLNAERLLKFQQAAEELMEVSSSSSKKRGPWPARLVALEATNAMRPFQLEPVEAQLRDFCQQLQGMPELEGFQSQDEEEDLEDDEPYVDKAMENVDKDYMWRLAKAESFDPSDCRLIKLPEHLVLRVTGRLRAPRHSLALPTVATCCLCGLEGAPSTARSETM